MSDPRAHFMSGGDARQVESLSQGHLSAARAAWLQGDFDAARLAYQKTAYISGRLRSEDTKLALKRELTGFSKSDPLYGEVLAEIVAVVAQQPGIKQTELYSLVDRDQQTIGYVLYFADQNLDLHRKRAGRTHQVFPPGRTIDG